MPEKLPTFTRCADGKFYQELVYQDFPERRAWFICFDSKEPAEIVVREDMYKELRPEEILKRRGFGACMMGLVNGRKDPHRRFFGFERDILTGIEKPAHGHDAISWFIAFKKGVPLPTPNKYDSCEDFFSIFPNKPGVYFGDKR